jgi:hypothetical protein
MTSLQMTNDAGTKNQIIPSRILLTIKWLETTMRNRLMWTQQKRANCCRRCCRWRLATKPTKPVCQSPFSVLGLRVLTDNVKHERDESVITGERDKVGIDKDNVLEVVDDGFSV